MNPSELRMLWMNQYNPDRLSIENATSYLSHPSVGLSVMEDVSEQEAVMNMNQVMSVVAGDYSGQGTSATLRVRPTLITGPNANDLFGISQVGGLHQVLHQSSALQNYPGTSDQEESISISGAQYATHVFDGIHDNKDDDISGLSTKSEIINIDDFVIMAESNSYDGTENMTCDMEISRREKDVLAQNKARSQRKSRKIEPVSRPGLVLKTPIAYKGNIDPSVIPIQKDGMAVCERCGAIGVKHTFYTKSRRFCSMACARGELFSLVCNKMVGSTATESLPTSGLPLSSSPSFSDDMNSNNHQRSGIDFDLRVPCVKSPNSNYSFKITNQTLTQINDNKLIDETDNDDNVDSDKYLAQKQFMYRDVLPHTELPQIPKYECLPYPCPQSEKICSVRRRQGDPLHSYDWTQKLSHPDSYVAPVTSFPHAPGYDMWDDISIDMKVEVENTDCESQEVVQSGQTPHSFWVATILNICGYKALMRYEGFDESSHDFWVNLCSSEVHSVGWCATRGKPLIPPRTIESKYKDWKDFLVERLSGARTLPSNFYNKISESMNSRFRLGLNLECVDKNKISQVKLATVNKIVGKRLFVKYFDSDDGFWCHEDSPIIHPVGWATTVGHNLAAPQDYLERMLAGREHMIEVHDDDATIELFKMNFTFEEYYIDGKRNNFVEGMKLEAVDPLNLSSICAATVMAVLKFGYMMIRIDSYQADATASDWFCYHEKSPNIFPVGFCEKHNIYLTPPNGYDPQTFSWNAYLKETKCIAAGEHLFHRFVPNHGFEVGMSLECADLMDPRLVCVATVARVVGRLLKIHFDGWTEEYDQWLDCESPDVYPVGWCVLVNHKLEGPPVQSKIALKMTIKPKHKKKRKKIIRPDTSSFGERNVNRSINIKREGNDQCQQRNFTSDNLGVKIEMKTEPLFYDDELCEKKTENNDISQSSEALAYELEEENEISSTERTSSFNINMNANPLAPPIERKATSYIGNSTVSNTKYIPRLIDVSQDSICNQQTGDLMPEAWNIYDVSQFLRVNDCIAHCDIFSRNKIDGRLLLHLSKDEIITLLGMKVGPALKIFDLIQQLKCKLNPSKSRLLRANKLFL